MTTPRVTELRRRLEATAPDTFLTAAATDDRPLATVVVLRPRDPARGRRPRTRRSAPALRVVGPGDSAA